MDYCEVCGEPQYDSPSGVTCDNGHGGAGSKLGPPQIGMLAERLAEIRTGAKNGFETTGEMSKALVEILAENERLRGFAREVRQCADESFAEGDLALWSDAVGSLYDAAREVLGIPKEGG